MKRVLILTYYWPPSGGAGVQRCLKYAKYLRDFGWEPVIYTAKDAHYPIHDESLKKDIPEGITVIKKEIWEPFDAYKKFIGISKEEKVQPGFLEEKGKESFKKKLAVWIRGNFFIPDARMFWIKPSVKFLIKYLKENPVDAIVSSGPPHSMHLIARGINRKLNIPWIADFRDPWTDIDFYEKLNLTFWADRKHKRLERSVLKEADKVITVSWSWAEGLKELGASEVKVITNGYDPDNFSQIKEITPEKFNLLHSGYINKDRNPDGLWKVLKKLVTQNQEFADNLKITLIGKVDISVLNAIHENDLTKYLQKIDYVPHKEAVKKLKEAQVLILLINDTPNQKGIIPGKVFEYLAAKRYILCIGPDFGDSASIIKKSGAGLIAGHQDEEALEKAVMELFGRYQEGKYIVDSTGIEEYSRKKLTGELAEVLNEIT